MLLTRTIAIGLALAAVTPSAIAQSIEAAPSSGVLTLGESLDPDRHIVNVTAGGGDIDAPCGGVIAEAANLHLDYVGASLPLIISAASSADTSLLVAGPDGAWYCDADSGEEGLNPSIRFDLPESGTYAIWVGAAATNAQAELTISNAISR